MMKRSVRIHAEKTGNSAYLNLVPFCGTAERTSSEGAFDKAYGLHPQGPFAKAYGMFGECIRRRSIIGYANIWQ
ncbi:hypothetical protein C1H46_009071 [Malus baccata]|uniref:Uncharacterized protein n=1 Tax=Malus baccata TaxID=106549 RepID=A0A540N2L5_MALBA|nr:hypothetical protein C1H46_009071 [Malus baccata]